MNNRNIIFQKIDKLDSSTTDSEYNNLVNQIKNIYNLQTFEILYNGTTYNKLVQYKKKQDITLENKKISKNMLNRYNETVGLRIDMNFNEFDRVKNKLNALRLIFFLVSSLIIIPILVFSGVLSKVPGILIWGICVIVIAITGLFFMYIKDKNKSKFCYKDEDGFEKCIEAEETERYYKYLPNKKQNSFQEKAEIVKKMSEREKIKCRKWDAVKKEFDFDVDCKEARCNLLSGTNFNSGENEDYTSCPKISTTS